MQEGVVAVHHIKIDGMSASIIETNTPDETWYGRLANGLYVGVCHPGSVDLITSLLTARILHPCEPHEDVPNLRCYLQG